MSLFRGFDAESLPSVWDCGQQAQMRLLPADWQLLGEDSFLDVSEDGVRLSVGVRLYQHRTDPSCFYEVTRRTPSGEPWDGWTVGVDLTQQQAEEWFVVHEVAPPNHLRAAWESSLKGPARAGGSDPLPESESRTGVDNRGSDSESSGADVKSELLSLSRMARRLGVTQHWLKDQADLRKVPCLKAGKRYLFSPLAVEEALAAEASRRRENEGM